MTVWKEVVKLLKTISYYINDPIVLKDRKKMLVKLVYMRHILLKNCVFTHVYDIFFLNITIIMKVSLRDSLVD